MRKNAMVLCCYICVAAAFGAFFRWIQNMASFETETGLYLPGSLWSKVMVLVCLAAVAGLLGLVLGLRKKEFFPATTVETVFQGNMTVLRYLYTGFGILMAVGGGVLFVVAKFQADQTILRLLGFLAILAGVSFPYLMSAPFRTRERAMLCLCSTLLVLMQCFWLVVSYKIHATLPSAWSYGVEIVAISANALGFYYLAGYAFGRVRPYRTLLFCAMGALLSLVTLADTRQAGMQMMFVASAGMLMYAVWMVVSSMRTEKLPTAAPEETPKTN